MDIARDTRGILKEEDAMRIKTTNQLNPGGALIAREDDKHE